MTLSFVFVSFGAIALNPEKMYMIRIVMYSKPLQVLFFVYLLLHAPLAKAQTFHADQSKLQWVIGGHDPRLGFEVIASCIDPAGNQEVSLRVKNLTEQELSYDVTVIIKANDGSTKSFSRKSGIKPGKVIGGNPWMDGASFSFKCERKSYGKTKNGGECKSYIAGVSLQVNNIKAKESPAPVEKKETVKTTTTTKATTAPKTTVTTNTTTTTTTNSAAQQQQQQNLETLKRINDHNQARQQRIQEAHRRVDQATDYTKSMVSGVIASNKASKDFKQNNTLSGNYQSVDELMADFDRRMANVNNLVSNMRTQHQNRVNTMANAYWGGNNSRDVALNQGAKLLGAISADIEAKKKEREAREELERQKAAHLAKLKAERKRMLTELRTDLIARFKEGSLPLTSSRLKEQEIYYFVYAYDPSAISSDKPQLYVSNVFPIGRYNDGTWPLKNIITKAITPLTPYKEVLHGYYTSRSEAEGMRKGMIEVFQKTGGVVSAVSYKGKPVATTRTTDDDYWEMGDKKPAASKKPVAKTSEQNNDFWEMGNRPKTPSRKREPGKKSQEKPEPANTPVQVDTVTLKEEKKIDPAIAASVARVQDFAKKLGTEYGFLPGLTQPEFLSFNTRISTANLRPVPNDTSIIYVRTGHKVEDHIAAGPSMYTVDKKSERVNAYTIYVQSGKNKQQESLAVFEQIKDKITASVDPQYVHHSGDKTTDYQLASIILPSADDPNTAAYFIQVARGKYRKITYVLISFGINKHLESMYKNLANDN